MTGVQQVRVERVLLEVSRDSAKHEESTLKILYRHLDTSGDPPAYYVGPDRMTLRGPVYKHVLNRVSHLPVSHLDFEYEDDFNVRFAVELTRWLTAAGVSLEKQTFPYYIRKLIGKELYLVADDAGMRPVTSDQVQAALNFVNEKEDFWKPACRFFEERLLKLDWPQIKSRIEYMYYVHAMAGSFEKPPSQYPVENLDSLMNKAGKNLSPGGLDELRKKYSYAQVPHKDSMATFGKMPAEPDVKVGPCCSKPNIKEVNIEYESYKVCSNCKKEVF
jgi:hypothetical protein